MPTSSAQCHTSGLGSLRIAAALAVLALTFTGCGTPSEAVSAADVEPQEEQTATETEETQGDIVSVIRVIDGDTIMVDRHGDEERVRLLNVDTPETSHPERPVECLGPEATEFLESQLAPGDEVKLEYDEERTDRYGRTLAGVFKDGLLLNAEIARHGYGAAVVYEPNRRFHPEVLAAQQEAEEAQVGLFDPEVGCTLPGAVEAALTAVDDLPAEPDASDPAGTADAATDASTLIAAATALLDLVASGDHPHLTAAYTARQEDDKADVDQAFQTADDLRIAAENLEAAQRQAAEDRAAEARTTEQHPAEDQRTEETPAAPAQPPAPTATHAPEPPRSSAPTPSPAPAPSDTPAPSSPPAPAPNSHSGGNSNHRGENGGSGSGGTPATGPQDRPAGYLHKDEPTNYTGPRCFLPGGQWWKPC